MAISLEMQRAQDLTTVEQPVLDLWLDKEQDGDEHAAQRILLAGLDAEHFISALPLDFTTITPKQRAELAGLLQVTRSLGVAIPRIDHLESVPDES